jgi:hypothetical protein
LVCTFAASLAFGITIAPSNTANDSAVAGYFPGGLDGQLLTVNWEGGQQNVGLVQFDLSPYMGDIFPHWTLNLFHLWNVAPGAQFGILPNTSPWVGVTTDWASLPTTGFGPTLSIADSQTGVWRSVDVTAIVQDWLSGTSPNYGFTIERLDQPNPVVYFTSDSGSYGGYAPQLVASSSVPEPDSVVLLGMALTLAFCGSLRRRLASGGK